MSYARVLPRLLLALLCMASIALTVRADVWRQTDWTGGPGQLAWNDSTMYYTGTNVDAWQSPGDVTLAWDLFTWVNTGDLAGATYVYSILEASDGTFYAGTGPGGDVFKSTDAGITWFNTGDLTGATEVHSVMQASDGALYAGTNPSGNVFKSVDAGTIWVNTGDLIGAELVYVVMEASDGDMYAVTYPNGNVFKSTDAGATWGNTGDLSGADQVRSIIEASDGALYAATVPANVFKSTDEGVTWGTTGVMPTAENALSILEAYDGVLYTGTIASIDTARVFRSTDAGTTWASTGEMLDAVAVYCIVEPWAGALLAGTGFSFGDVFGSGNGGATWINMGDLSGATNVRSLMAAASGMIYAGTGPNGDVFRTSSYFTAGDIISSVYETPNPDVDYGLMTWTETLNGQSIQLQVRTDTLPDMSTAMDWGTCPPAVNGQDISDLASVDDFEQYVQYRVELATANPDVSPVLHEVSITYVVDVQGPIPDSAVASDGTNPIPGIDDDDYVTITFDETTNKPSIDAANIDQALSLSGGHSWLDGLFGIGGANWNPAGDVLVVLLSDNISPPTVAVGDVIIPDGVTITDEWGNPAVSAVTITGSFDPPGVDEYARFGLPAIFSLSQNEPNPFSGETIIEYSLPSNLHITLEVYDVSGRLIKALVDGVKGPGLHENRWSPENRAAGIYFYRLKTADFERTRKMVVVN